MSCEEGNEQTVTKANLRVLSQSSSLPPPAPWLYSHQPPKGEKSQTTVHMKPERGEKGLSDCPGRVNSCTCGPVLLNFRLFKISVPLFSLFWPCLRTESVQINCGDNFSHSFSVVLIWAAIVNRGFTWMAEQEKQN